MAVCASACASPVRPRLRRDAPMRSASIGAVPSAAAACSTSWTMGGMARRAARVCEKASSAGGSGRRPCRSRNETSSNVACGARSSTSYPAIVRRPASPSTRLRRVDAATTPSRPSTMPSMVGTRLYIVNIDRRINVMAADRRFLTARQAADALGVTTETLYAYASRGQVQSEPAPGRTRQRRYYREDIERLIERKDLRRDPAKVAARGLHWGSPVLASGITLIQGGALYYRGQNVQTLAAAATLEQVAELLWAAAPEERGRVFDQPCPVPARELARLRSQAHDAVTRFQMALPLAASLDRAAHDLRPAAVRRAGARIMRLVTAIVSGRQSPPAAHIALQGAWVPRSPAVADAIRSALVLCADHELNVSAFTARCVASAAASPYDTVSAALAALKGSRHGGDSARVVALLAEIGTPNRARRVVGNRLRLGERIPGFGHPLYPAGDPRAATLLQLAEDTGHKKEWTLIRSVQAAATDLLQEPPNLDFGLAAVARAFRLPDAAPLVLFAMGRTAGWIAHAIEQYATETLIRPRARYTGPVPPV